LGLLISNNAVWGVFCENNNSWLGIKVGSSFMGNPLKFMVALRNVAILFLAYDIKIFLTAFFLWKPGGAMEWAEGEWKLPRSPLNHWALSCVRLSCVSYKSRFHEFKFLIFPWTSAINCIQIWCHVKVICFDNYEYGSSCHLDLF